MKIDIRKAELNNYKEMLDLFKNTVKNINSKDYSKDHVEIWANNITEQKLIDSHNKTKRWVALNEEGKIVGSADHGFDGVVYGIYVHEDFIGKGIGQKLLKTLESSMKKLDINTINLKSSITAQKFYEKNGYKTLGEDYHSVGEDKKVKVFVMQKQL